MKKKQKSYSQTEQRIRYEYLTRTVLERTKAAHAEGRYTWTPEEQQEISAMIDEAEELRQALRRAEGKQN